MKTIRLFIVLVCLLPILNVFGQITPIATDTITQQLKGTWYVVNGWPATKDTLVFKRVSRAPRNLGDRIEIFENGEMIDAYSAPCGNDNRSHHTKGKWTLDKNEMIIITTVPIYLNRPKNKILLLTPETLVLLRLE